MKNSALAVSLTLMCVSSAVLAVDKGQAKFMGGTISSVPEKTDGMINLKGEDRLLWIGEKGRGQVEIPWTSVTEMEYGQKVGMRWRSAILLSPLALFSKARKHFVTLSFKDSAGKEQAAVFEFDKDEIRMAMASMKARTGKDFTYQDEQAKKQMGGGGKK